MPNPAALKRFAGKLQHDTAINRLAFFAGLLKARFAAIVFAMILRNALENPSEL